MLMRWLQPKNKNNNILSYNDTNSNLFTLSSSSSKKNCILNWGYNNINSRTTVQLYCYHFTITFKNGHYYNTSTKSQQHYRTITTPKKNPKKQQQLNNKITTILLHHAIVKTNLRYYKQLTKYRLTIFSCKNRKRKRKYPYCVNCMNILSLFSRMK